MSVAEIRGNQRVYKIMEKSKNFVNRIVFLGWKNEQLFEDVR